MLAHYAILNDKIKLSNECIFKIFRVSKSGYYNWVKKYNNGEFRNNEQKQNDEKLVMLFKEIIAKVGYVPGKRTFRTYLFRDYNMLVNLKKIKRIMNEYNIYPTLPKKDAYKGQATHNHECARFQNHVNQNFKIQPRKVILTDITYLYYGLKRELCYLCCFKDAYTKEILGSSISKSMAVKLVCDAYNYMMSKHGKEFNKDIKVYIHSDQGSQYLATEFSDILSDDGFIQSTSARGNSQDNAPMESFFGRMKTSLIDLLALAKDYDTTVDLVNNFLNTYNNQYQYNLAGLSPKEFYLYVTTGIYPLDSYFGVKATKLHSIADLVQTSLNLIKEKQDKIKQRNKEKRELKAKINEPKNIVKRDKYLIQKEINKLETIKVSCDNQLKKLNELLDEINVAEIFLESADKTILDDVTIPTNWINYPKLNYVYKMNSFF